MFYPGEILMLIFMQVPGGIKVLQLAAAAVKRALKKTQKSVKITLCCRLSTVLKKMELENKRKTLKISAFK